MHPQGGHLELEADLYIAENVVHRAQRRSTVSAGTDNVGIADGDDGDDRLAEYHRISKVLSGIDEEATGTRPIPQIATIPICVDDSCSPGQSSGEDHSPADITSTSHKFEWVSAHLLRIHPDHLQTFTSTREEVEAAAAARMSISDIRAAASVGTLPETTCGFMSMDIAAFDGRLNCGMDAAGSCSVPFTHSGINATGSCSATFTGRDEGLIATTPVLQLGNDEPSEPSEHSSSAEVAVERDIRDREEAVDCKNRFFMQCRMCKQSEAAPTGSPRTKASGTVLARRFDTSEIDLGSSQFVEL